MLRSPVNERTPLAHLPLLVAVSVALASAFVFLHLWPTQMEATSGLDPITLSMLRLRLEHTPDRTDLRLMLARTQLAAGDYEATIDTLKPLESGQTPESRASRLLALEAKVGAWRSVPLQAPGKSATRARVVEHLESVSTTALSRAQIEHLENIALEVGRADLAAAFELALAQRGGDESVRCKGAQGPVCHALKAIERALLTGSSLFALTVAADAVRLFPRHQSLVHRAVGVALAAHAVNDAIVWLEVMLPYDPGRQTLDTLVALEMGNERPDRALTHLQNRLKQDPSAIDLRPQIAQMAEWAGEPEVALDAWALIGRDTRDIAGLDRARVLAEQLADIPLVCQLLLQKGQLTRLSSAEIADLERSCDTSMLTDELAWALEKYVARHPLQLPALKLLAITLERAGAMKRALLVREEIYRLDPAAFKTLFSLVALRWRMSGQTEAWRTLVEHRREAGKNDVEYWRLLAALAWDLEHDDEARTALEALWMNDEPDETVAERLLVLATERNDYDDLIRVGEEAWAHFQTPHWLTTAMEAAVAAKRWETLRRLLATSRLAPTQFETSARWWMLVVELADHDQDEELAMKGLQQAIALNPFDKSNKGTFLWRALQFGDLSLLKRAVKVWEADAAEEPVIWRPLAAGLHRLGKENEAASWLVRAATSRVQDLEWQVGVAEEFEAIERNDLALPVWRHVETMFENDPEAPLLLRDRVRLKLARLFHGVSQIERAADRLIANHPANLEMRTDVVYVWLEHGKPQRARDVLLGSPAPLALSVQVHVALASIDLERLAILLDTGAPFTSVERVEALRAIGRLTQAWIIAKAHLPNAAPPEREQLLQHVHELRALLGSRASVALGSERHHGVALDSLAAKVSTGFEAGRIAVASALNRVHGFSDVYEFDATVALERSQARYFSRASVGLNARPDSILPQLGALYRHHVGEALELGAELRMNSLEDLSPALRAVGSESRVGGVAQVGFGQDTVLMAEAWARRLSIRNEGPLAHGFAAHVTVEHSLRFSAVDLSLSLTGSVEKNRFTPDRLNPNAPVEQRGEVFAAASAVLLGGGVSAESPWSLPRPFVPRWRFTLWTGWLVPEHRNAFNAQLEAALPVSNDITFIIDGFISNDEPWLHDGSTSAGARLTGRLEF